MVVLSINKKQAEEIINKNIRKTYRFCLCKQEDCWIAIDDTDSIECCVKEFKTKEQALKWLYIGHEQANFPQITSFIEKILNENKKLKWDNKMLKAQAECDDYNIDVWKERFNMVSKNFQQYIKNGNKFI